MAYMLIGYDKNETWDRIWHRFTRMVERGISPYPMVYDRKRRDLKCFQRWVIVMGGMYRWIVGRLRARDEERRERRGVEAIRRVGPTGVKP
jgi:hypothetical protein